MNGTPKMIQPSYLLKLTWPVFVEPVSYTHLTLPTK